MIISRSLLSLDANTDRLPEVTAYGETADGLALELRADPAGVLDLPGLPKVLIAVHVGHSAKISCRRAGPFWTPANSASSSKRCSVILDNTTVSIRIACTSPVAAAKLD